ncbi:MAG TPA: zinc ribbon domain-containing protein [Candidatus Eremiobacteraeota bacterium]|nr:MAG: hypothetical protein BWY64_01068 [bacterium ADurb.Bin363]HPZ07427.1 zinc ribbon domain-containing protein [Candidatus Eremiobacteraeota bacterium]
MIYCWKCGQPNDDFSGFCNSCGVTLKSPVQPVMSGDSPESAVNTLIPYKNIYALIAYYLGVFSIIPCIGIILGIAAFFLGLKGLALANERPEVKGKIHAWIGIIIGGLFGFGYLILFYLFILTPH